MAPLTLYDTAVSSYAQKVRIALREKALPFTSIVPDAISTGTTSDPALAAANPRLEVPALLDGATGDAVAVFDSTIILEYLEDAYPTPPLLPAPAARGGARARAKARMIEEVCDTAYEAVNWGWGEVLWFGRAEHDAGLRAALAAEAEAQTRVLQAWLEGQLGGAEWFGGEFGFGWADLCVVPMVNRSRWFGWGPVEGSGLAAWLERVRKRESVRVTLDEFEDGAAKMGGRRDAFESGGRRREYRDHRLEWMVKSGGLDIVLKGLEKGNIRFGWPERQIS